MHTIRIADKGAAGRLSENRWRRSGGHRLRRGYDRKRISIDQRQAARADHDHRVDRTTTGPVWSGT